MAFVDRRRHEVSPDLGSGSATGSASGNKAPEPALDDVEHPRLEPVRVEVLGVDAEPLGQRAVRARERSAHAVHGWEGMLGRDGFGGIWIPTSGIIRRASVTTSSSSASVTELAQVGSGTRPAPRAPWLCAS